MMRTIIESSDAIMSRKLIFADWLVLHTHSESRGGQIWGLFKLLNMVPDPEVPEETEEVRKESVKMYFKVN